jgi:hypothetical protein
LHPKGPLLLHLNPFKLLQTLLLLKHVVKLGLGDSIALVWLCCWLVFVCVTLDELEVALLVH